MTADTRPILRRIYDVNTHPMNPRSWVWLPTPRPEILGLPHARLAPASPRDEVHRAHVQFALLYRVQDIDGPGLFEVRDVDRVLLALASHEARAKSAAIEALSRQFEVRNRADPKLIRLRPLGQVRMQQGHWSAGFEVLDPATHNPIGPPMGRMLAIEAAVHRWGPSVGLELTA